MPSITSQELLKMSQIFKILSNENRLKTLHFLFEKERSVGELTELTQMTQSAVSHQLKLLKDHQIVSSSKHGQQVIYALKDHHIFELLSQAREHVAEDI